LLVDLGMPRVPVLDLQPVHQWPDERPVERLLPELVERPLRLGRPDEDLQPCAPGVAAEVVEARLRLGLLDDVVDARGDDACATGRGHDRSI
jgi:hypothetical protein